MISPTGVTYANYWNAIKAGNRTHVRFTFIGQNIVLDDSDVYLNSGVTVTDMFNGDTDLVFGKALSKEVTVTFINSSKLNGLKWTGEFTLEFGVEISGTTKWVNIGYFYGEKPNNVTTNELIRFVAHDRMQKFDILADDYVKSIIYPKTLQQIYNGLCSFVGVSKVSGDELPGIMSRSYAYAPIELQGYTCRDILSWIAEACGCYAKINSAGKVKMAWYTDNTAHAITGTEEFSVESADANEGLTWDEADTYTWDEFDNFMWNDVCGYQETYKIDQLLVKQVGDYLDVNYPYAFGGNVYMIAENPFLTVSEYADVGNYIAPIYNRMDAFGGYLPVELDCIGNWCVEAGDIITVDVKGETVSLPIFVKTMVWNGGINDSYETTGKSVRDTYTSDSNRQKVMTSNRIELFATDYKEELKDDFYQIRSGIAIEPGGVEISGSKYLKLESGSTLDIHSSGTLDLEGSSVSIKSNSTFDLDSTNLKIDSTNGIMEILNGGLKVKRRVADTNYLYNLYLGNIFGSDYDQEQLKAGFVASWLESIINSQNVRTYPIILHVDDFISSPGIEWETEVYFGRRSFTKDMHLHSQTREMQVLSGIYVQTINMDTHSVLTSAIESKLGIFENVDADYIDAYKVSTRSLEYQLISQVSSKDIKHDIKELPSVGEKIDKLKPVTFVYDNDESEKKRMGLIYEDTMEVMPEICTQDESNKAISYVELIPALLKEIQDLRARVKALEEREVN